MKTKKCSKCGEEKPEICFAANSDGKDGLYSQCRDCKSAYVSKRRQGKRKPKRYWTPIDGFS